MNLWLGKKPLQQSLLSFLLLAAVVIAIYYPALTGGIHTIDDPGIVSLYSSSPSLSKVLAPGTGYYYRPLLELSYWIDQRLWGMAPSAMHLENVLLHLANAALVFALARLLCSRQPEAHPLLPLGAAFLFALHPVNVEAVGWIAGRTDPMLALFCLSACFFWVKWLDSPKVTSLLMAGALFVCAALTKEVALAFIPVALILAYGLLPRQALVSRRTVALLLLAALVSGGLLFLLVMQHSGSFSAIARLLSPNDARLGTNLQAILAAFGFYCRKMLFPLPLNFAITDIPAPYALLGIMVALGLPLSLRRGKPASCFFAAAALMVIPALVLVLRNISWTPVAERYLYLPTAFFSLGVCSFLSGRERKVQVAALLVLALLVSGSALVCQQRNALWQDKEQFYRDALVKSPYFAPLYNELGALLLRDNRVDAAAQAFASADRLNHRPSAKYVIKGNIMATILAKGDYPGVRSYFFSLFPDKAGAPPVFLEMLQTADRKRLASLSGEDKTNLTRDIIATLVLLHEKTLDPFWLYECGKFALALNALGEAKSFFLKAYQFAPHDALYRPALKKQLLHLGSRP
ncbi:ArnT family glycosyltransferase [Citrifermentans bremense]|uniref:ArnT family glycosyltransferase n=1 Tax=Citrifermentans bremense TaxID=60035 RepID=UPI000415A14A|nr:glycosyltransferase family 39 protein [Citrifermentans bremense]